MKNRVLASVLAAVSLISFAPLQAAPITWSGNILTGTGTTHIDTSGSLIEAHNAGAGATAISVGGVLFDNAAPSPLDSVFFGSNPGNITGDANFDSLLNNASYSTNGGIAQAVALSGLTIGVNYLVQFFSADSRGCCTGRIVTVNDGEGNQHTSLSIGQGYVFTGQFTADAATQNVNFTGVPHGYINAWQLRQAGGAASVPVSATSLLLLLGLVGFRRRLRSGG